jgi:hypothetical protein
MGLMGLLVPGIAWTKIASNWALSYPVAAFQENVFIVELRPRRALVAKTIPTPQVVGDDDNHYGGPSQISSPRRDYEEDNPH